jgi:hypothetical protein
MAMMMMIMMIIIIIIIFNILTFLNKFEITSNNKLGKNGMVN